MDRYFLQFGVNKIVYAKWIEKNKCILESFNLSICPPNSSRILKRYEFTEKEIMVSNKETRGQELDPAHTAAPSDAVNHLGLNYHQENLE